MLKLENIVKIFNMGTINEKKALQGVSITIEDGDFITVIGGNGAGKSTMLNLIAGVFPPEEGKIYLGEKDVTALPEYKRAKFLGHLTKPEKEHRISVISRKPEIGKSTRAKDGAESSRRWKRSACGTANGPRRAGGKIARRLPR